MHAFLDQDLTATDQGTIEPICQPDWDSIERSVFDDAGIRIADVRDAEREKALRMFIRLKSWDFKNGMKDPIGLMERAAVSSWAVVPLLRPLTLTRFALCLGLKKQSLGRWVDDFKLRFPEIRNDHMRE